MRRNISTVRIIEQRAIATFVYHSAKNHAKVFRMTLKINQIRLHNLEVLIAEAGSAAKLARGGWDQ